MLAKMLAKDSSIVMFIHSMQLFPLFSNEEKFRYPILGGFVQTAHLSDYRVVMLHTFAQEAHYKGGWSDDA